MSGFEPEEGTSPHPETIKVELTVKVALIHRFRLEID
jgi:hypothetical protein